MLFVFVFFFKQKTAYEMRISDWSSDVCSSDLRRACATGRRCARRAAGRRLAVPGTGNAAHGRGGRGHVAAVDDPVRRTRGGLKRIFRDDRGFKWANIASRSEGGRVGKEGVSACRSRWLRLHEKKKQRQD